MWRKPTEDLMVSSHIMTDRSWTAVENPISLD
jgi:hypothetical protein